LKRVVGDLLKPFSGMHSDPALHEAIEQWPEDAEKEP